MNPVERPGVHGQKADRAVVAQARDDERVLDDPPPKVMLTNFADSAVEFQLWVSVADAVAAIGAGSDLRLRIWDAFQQNGITIPFPQRDLHVRSSDVPLAWPPPDSDATKPQEG